MNRHAYITLSMVSSHTSDLSGEPPKNLEPAPTSGAIAGVGDDDGRTAETADDEAPPPPRRALVAASPAAGNRAREGRERGAASPREPELGLLSGEGRVECGAILDCLGSEGRSGFMAGGGGRRIATRGRINGPASKKPSALAERRKDGGAPTAVGAETASDRRGGGWSASLDLRNVARAGNGVLGRRPLAYHSPSAASTFERTGK